MNESTASGQKHENEAHPRTGSSDNDSASSSGWLVQDREYLVHDARKIGQSRSDTDILKCDCI